MKKKINIRLLAGLLLEFLRIGFLAFGGAWGIIAQMRERFVEKRGLLTEEELLDVISVGRSLPGIMIGNTGMLFGYRLAGYAGGAVCVLGLMLPPMLILILVSLLYEAFRANPWVGAAMDGMRMAVVPIIFCAAGKLIKGSFRFPPCYAVAALSFALFLFFDVSCVWLVVIGLTAGIAICEYYERREGPGHGAA